MSDQSKKNYSILPEVLAADDSEGGSRRGFLKISAAVAASLLGACADAPVPGEDKNGGSEGERGGSGGGGKSSGGGNGTAGDNLAGSKVGSTGTGGKSGSGESGAAGETTEDETGGTTKTGSGGGSTGGTTKQGTKGGSTGTGGKAPGSDAGPGKTDGGGKVGSGGSVNAGGTTKTQGDGGGSPPADPGDFVENRGESCTIGTVSSKANPKLPDPFKFLSGTRISKKEDWACLRAELSAALQACIYGPKMPPPDSLKATFSGGKVTVDMKVGSTSKSFSFSISGGGSADSPKPCLITCGGSSLSALNGVAKIDMSNNNFASESNLSGIVKDLYGNACSKSGALIGWAWGCSRIIDALSQCPDAGIDVTALAVTGCSRNGKGALAMGAFDERVALTLVQEGGSGGTALWRVSSKEYSMGQKIQEATEIVGEASWQGSDFKSYTNDVTKLPADQHFAVALCAPRGIMVFENDIDWLGPVATYGGAVAGRKVYEALGIKDRCGVAITSSHTHCSFPSAEQKYLDAYVNRFLKKQKTDTTVDTFKAGNTKLGSFKEADWIDWDIPTLSGSLAWDPWA